MNRYGIDKVTLKEMNRQRPWIIFTRIFFEYSLIVFTSYFTDLYFSIPLYLLAALIIGSRFHALGVLMHEGSHYRLHTNRKLNEILSTIMSSTILIPFDDYRSNHLTHHKNLNSQKDPDFIKRQTNDWSFPKSRKEYAWVLLKDLVGINSLNLIQNLKHNKKNSKSKSKSQYFVFYTIVIIMLAAISFFGLLDKYIIYCILPIATITKTIMRLRAAADHFGINRKAENASRDTIYHPILREFLIPCGIGYHAVHHVFMGVPYYNLPKLFKLLEQNEQYRKDFKITYGLKSLLNDLTYPNNLALPIREANA
jgi:fatty acid desaturase